MIVCESACTTSALNQTGFTGSSFTTIGAPTVVLVVLIGAISCTGMGPCDCAEAAGAIASTAPNAAPHRIPRTITLHVVIKGHLQRLQKLHILRRNFHPRFDRFFLHGF